jgi:Fe-S-cluster-containing dehydrogenase component
MTACKSVHGIAFGEQQGREYYRIWPEEVEEGAYPYVIRIMTPVLCMQCQEPPCVEACPVPGAIYSREDGIVLIDDGACDGCGKCIPACPYGALYLREDRGVVDKCTFCVEDIDAGREPVCVTTCPADALHFGDLDDPGSEVAKMIREKDARQAHPEYETQPSVYYTAHAARLKGTVTRTRMGHPLQGVTVMANGPEQGETHITSTDSNGVFFFWDLAVRKTYTLRIEAQGLSPVVRDLYLDDSYTDLGALSVGKNGS